MKYYKTLKDFKNYSDTEVFDVAELGFKVEDLKGNWVNFKKEKYPVFHPFLPEKSEKIMRYFWFKYPCTYTRYMNYSMPLFYNFIFFLHDLTKNFEDKFPVFLNVYKKKQRDENPIDTRTSAEIFAMEQAWTDVYRSMDSYFTDPENVTIFEALHNPIYRDELEGDLDCITEFDCTDMAWDFSFKGRVFSISLRKGEVKDYEHFKTGEIFTAERIHEIITTPHNIVQNLTS